MSLTYFYLALIIGICLDLICEEVFGIVAGGSICPGFFAMICDDLPTVFLILTITLIIYILVQYVLPKFMIIYGKRRFTVVIALAVILKLFFEQFYPALPFAVVGFRGIGIMSTGVLANNCIRQGFRYTIPACVIVTGITYTLAQLIVTVV